MVMVRATVTIPGSLLADVDRYAGKGGRSAFVAEALLAAVKRERLGRAIEETRGAPRGSEHWQTAEETYRWVREQRMDREADR